METLMLLKILNWILLCCVRLYVWPLYKRAEIHWQGKGCITSLCCTDLRRGKHILLRIGSATSSNWRLKHRRRGQNVQSDPRREVNRWRSTAPGSIAPGTPGKKFKAALMSHDKFGPTAQQLPSGQLVLVARSKIFQHNFASVEWNDCIYFPWCWELCTPSKRKSY